MKKNDSSDCVKCADGCREKRSWSWHGMLCPFCGGETKIIDSACDGKTTYRVRKCKKCKKRFSAVEQMVDREVNVDIAGIKLGRGLEWNGE